MNDAPQRNVAELLSDKLRSKAHMLNRKEMDLIAWGMKYVAHYFERPFSHVHYRLADRLNFLRANRNQKEVIVMPRGYAKSTFASFLHPLKAICEGTERYILIGSDTADLAAIYLKNIKDELDGNELIKKDYPLACRHGDTWNTSRVETHNNVCAEVFGKGSGVRGRRFKQYRPTLIILDDPQKDDDVNSPTGREKDIEWVNRGLIPCGDTGTNYLIIGNDLHQESIVGVFSRKPAWHATRFSAIESWPDEEGMKLWIQWETQYWSSRNDAEKELCMKFYNDNKEAMERGTKVLWPEKESLLDLMILRADVGHSAFEAEKQNNPRDPSKSEFREEWFDDIYYDELPKNVYTIRIGYNDPAKGVVKRKRDYSATITLNFVPEHMTCYVEADIRRIPATELSDHLVNLHRLTPFDAFGMEFNGFQHLLGEELFAKLVKQGMLCNIIPIENYGTKKEVRISRLSVWLQRKFFRFKRGCMHTKMLLQQLRDHPFSEFDDGSDALEGALRVLTMVSNLDNAPPGTSSSDDFGDNLCDAML